MHVLKLPSGQRGGITVRFSNGDEEVFTGDDLQEIVNAAGGARAYIDHSRGVDPDRIVE
jgi:hypothetical protein